MNRKAVWAAASAAVLICTAVCLLNRPVYRQMYTEEIPQEPVSSLQKFQDEQEQSENSVPSDIREAVKRDIHRKKRHVCGERKISHGADGRGKTGWQQVYTENGDGIRYYETADSYAVGWRQLDTSGKKDWYYFDENTGFMVTDAAVDGAVLSEQGYACAVSAGSFQSVLEAEQSGHCEEALVIHDIEADRMLEVDKTFTCVTEKGKTCSIRAAEDAILNTLVKISGTGEFQTGKGIRIDAAGICKSAVSVQDAGKFICFGGAGDFSSDGIHTAVECQSLNGQILIGRGAVITGAGTGIRSGGQTVITGGSICGNGKVLKLPEIFGGYRLNVLSAASGSGIKGGQRASDISLQIVKKQGHGIEQTDGILIMTGGTIWDNGILGTDMQAGSMGGGILLSGSAEMEMSGGVIAANRACVGGGVYVSEDCRLTVTGGRIGGLNSYYENGKDNDSLCGNYARESSVALHGGMYRGGEGGGIYSLGTVILDGTDAVSIDCNSAKGGGGGGGIHAACGMLQIDGNVSVSGNRVYSSEAPGNSDLYGGGDTDAEGGGIRLGRETGNIYAQCQINQTKNGKEKNNVRIYGNTASGDGGGIYVSSDSSNLLKVCGGLHVRDNRCGTGGGGGIKSLGGKMQLSGTVISDNSVTDASSGGGLLTAGYLFLEDSTISGNYAGKSGGGICFYNSTAGTSGSGTVRNCMVYGNRAVSSGDGIMNESTEGEVCIVNTSVYENTGTKDGIRCAAGAILNMEGGAVYGNARYGISSAGSLALSGKICIGYRPDSREQLTPEKNGSGGIFSSGTGVVEDSSDIRIFSGSQSGLYNSGNFKAKAWKGKPSVFIDGSQTVNTVYNRGRLIFGGCITGGKWGIFADSAGHVELQEQGIVKESSEGIRIKNGGEIVASGTVAQCSGYGIYAESGSSFSVSGGFSCATECPVFLEPDCAIEVSGELYGKSVPTAVIDTKKDADRMPGRVLVHVSAAGMDAEDVLEGPEGLRFQTAFHTLDNGGRAAVRAGNMIRPDYAGEIDEDDIILSQRFLIHYNSGTDQIQGASENDVEMSQNDMDKYWMEDAVLNLKAPVLKNENMQKAGWKFLYWDGNNHTVYTGLQAVYESNADLTLTACWKQEKISSLQGYLYDYSSWLRQGGEGNKTDRIYTHFMAGDTGEIVFEYQYLNQVNLIWPDRDVPQSLQRYDRNGTYVQNQNLNTEAVAEKRFGCFRFLVPVDTPAGTYEVLLCGLTPKGDRIDCPLVLSVDDRSITSTFRTRIR